MKLRDYRPQLADCALLLLAVAAVYGRLLGADFQANWDDNIYILNNEAVRGFSWSHLYDAFKIGTIGQYNPLSLLSFMADYTLWGLQPGGYHLTNILIHALNGLLVYRLVGRLHGDRLVSLVAAALFLLHPVQVESVAWIAERKGLLSLLFFLVSWEGYCRYRDAEKGRGYWVYLGSVTSFLLALLAKTSSVILPLVLMLYDWCFPDRKRRVRLPDKIPFFLIAALFCVVEMLSESPDHGGSRVGYHGGSPFATFITMLPVFCRYLGLLAWPAGLNVEHLPPVYRSVNLVVVGAALLLAAVALLTVRLYRWDRKCGGWVIFFWLGLLPVSQIVPLFLLMYEHYLYMPIIGAATLAGVGAARLRDRIGRERSPLLYGALALWIGALSVTSFERGAVWYNSLTLFTDATSKSPDSFRAWEVLGGANTTAGRVDAARRAYERSLALFPTNTDVLWALGDLHTEAGELDQGYGYIQRVLRINPNYVKAWATLGTNYRERGNYSKAKEAYDRALALQPDAVQVAMLQGKLFLREREPDQARLYLGRVEKAGWYGAENAFLLCCAESLAGNKDRAMAWLEKALQRGYRDYYRINTDSNLSSLWNDPRFYFLTQRYFPDQDQR